MRGLRRLIAAAGVTIIAAVGSVSAQPAVAAVNAGLDAFAQAEKPAMTARVKTWTRARLEAAKKRWAEDQLKFSDCQRQLDEQRKTKRISLHKQGDFLQRCMIRKP
jgi:hypothetical protein